MSFNVAMLEAMREEGLDLEACIRVLSAGAKKADPTAAERKRRQRDKERAERDTSHRDVTRDKGFNERDNLTSQAQVSEPSGSSPSPRPWALPIGVSLQVWTDFLGNRKRKRLGNSDTAWKAFLDDLGRVSSQTGIPPPKLIEHAAAKGWGSINNPEQDQGHGRTHGMAGHQPSGLSSTARAAIAVFGPD